MLITFLQWCARMPLAGLHFFGAGLGWLVYALSPTYRRRCRENLRASGVCADATACRRLLHAAVAETGKGITETLIAGLQELEKTQQRSALRALRGKVKIELDLEETRR